MSELLTDVAELARYDEPEHSPNGLSVSSLSVIVGGFPTVPLERGASSFATALHIRERYAKFPITCRPTCM